MPDPVRYLYSLASRDEDQLHVEALVLALPGYLGLCGSPSGSQVEFLFAAALSASDVVRLGALVGAHQPSPTGPRDRLRVRAQAALSAQADAQAQLNRAVALAAGDGDNVLRAWVASFVAAVAAATSLADLKSRVAALGNLPQITPAIIKTAVANRVATTDADV